MTGKDLSLPASTQSAQISLFGMLKANQFDQLVYLGDSRSANSATVTSYTPPEDKFVQFMSSTWLSGPDFRHQAINTHAAYDVELLDIGLSVAHKENNTVTLSTASNLTTISVGFEYKQGANDHWWFVYAESGASRQVILPELPALITDALEVDDISLKFTAYTVSGVLYEEAPRHTDWIGQSAAMTTWRFTDRRRI